MTANDNQTPEKVHARLPKGHGFFSDGVLVVNDNTVTVHDRDRATLGSLTEIGNDTGLGTLNAPNGALLEAGKTLQGYGAVNGDFENQGNVIGDSMVERKSDRVADRFGGASFTACFADNHRGIRAYPAIPGFSYPSRLGAITERTARRTPTDRT